MKETTKQKIAKVEETIDSGCNAFIFIGFVVLLAVIISVVAKPYIGPSYSMKNTTTICV